jgi:hypothetical protein
MNISSLELALPTATQVAVTDTTLAVDLSDGRTITAPLAWFPRLVRASATERANWRFVGAGEGVHWPDIDEDVSVEGLIAGRPSAESAESLARWLAKRS